MSDHTHVQIQYGDRELAIPVEVLADLFRQNMPPALADSRSEDARKHAALLAAATALIRPLYKKWLGVVFGGDAPEKPKDEDLIPWLIRQFVAVAIYKMASEPIRLEVKADGNRQIVVGIAPAAETKSASGFG